MNPSYCTKAYYPYESVNRCSCYDCLSSTSCKRTYNGVNGCNCNDCLSKLYYQYSQEKCPTTCPVICPPGEPGTDGINGTNGTNGIDGTNGTDGANGRGGLIPFASGLLSVTNLIVGTPLYLGFGSSSFSSAASFMIGQFSIPIPVNGSLRDLETSIDANVLVNLSGIAPVYTFTILLSPSSPNNTVHATVPYAATSFSTSMTFNPSGLIPGPQSMTTYNPGPLMVLQGDRVVLRVSSSVALTLLQVSLIAFSASLSYTTP